jgi:hypothetical protein
MPPSGGVLLGPGQTLGEDMVVTLNVWRDASPAVALSYVQSAALPRDVLLAILHTHAYPNAAHAVRRAAVGMALRRAFVLLAQAIRDSRTANAESTDASSGGAGSGGGGLFGGGMGGGLFGGGMGCGMGGGMGGGTGLGAGELLCARPLREMLARENAAAAAAATSAVERGAVERGAVERGAVERADEHAATAELMACGERMEAAVCAVVERMRMSLAPQCGGEHAPPTRHRRAKRNVCVAKDAAPSAPTLAIAPGQGMPPDHLLDAYDA